MLKLCERGNGGHILEVFDFHCVDDVIDGNRGGLTGKLSIIAQIRERVRNISNIICADSGEIAQISEQREVGLFGEIRGNDEIVLIINLTGNLGGGITGI